MRITVFVSVGALLFAVVTTRAAAEPPATKTPPPLGRISLADPLGNMHSPTEWQVHKAVVLFFLGTECPVSNGYSPDMIALAAKYAKRGVACYGIYCEPDVTPEEVTAHAKGYGLTFSMLLDPGQALAKAVGARVTPDAVLLSPEGKVLYRGRIDNRYALDGKRRDVPSKHELVDAIDAVLAGNTPTVSQTDAYGCPLPKVEAPAR